MCVKARDSGGAGAKHLVAEAKCDRERVNETDSTVLGEDDCERVKGQRVHSLNMKANRSHNRKRDNPKL